MTRSPVDRVFLLCLGILQLLLALILLAPHFAMKALGDSQNETWMRIVTVLWLKFLVALPGAGLCCVIWGIAAPIWLKKNFAKSVRHFSIIQARIALALVLACEFVFASGA